MSTEASEMFKVLGVDTRIKIIELLKSKGPLGAKRISELIGITTAAVSQHLKTLKQCGFVRNERKGYWIPYSLNEKALEKCRCLLDDVCICGCGGTRKFKDQQLKRATLKSLKKYEKELKKELKQVRKRISKISGK